MGLRSCPSSSPRPGVSPYDCCRAASERRGNNLKRFNDFYLKADSGRGCLVCAIFARQRDLDAMKHSQLLELAGTLLKKAPLVCWSLPTQACKNPQFYMWGFKTQRFKKRFVPGQGDPTS